MRNVRRKKRGIKGMEKRIEREIGEENVKKGGERKKRIKEEWRIREEKWNMDREGFKGRIENRNWEMEMKRKIEGRGKGRENEER